MKIYPPIYKNNRMVCINEKLPIDYIQMRKLIIEELYNIIDNELYYVNELKDKKKEKNKKNIINEFRNRISSDSVIERMIHEDYCIYKHKRGKKDGQFCCKKITINGDKNKYVCTKHNKNHIPQKRHEKMIINKNINKSISICNSVKLLNQNIINKNGKKKNNYNIKRNKNIHINNFNKNIFKRVFNDYSLDIICFYKEKDSCKNITNIGCNFKHIEKEISFKDLYIKNNNINNSILTY